MPADTNPATRPAVGAARRVIAAIAVFVCLLPSAGRAEFNDDEIRRSAQSVLSDEAYQRELPFPEVIDDLPPEPPLRIPEWVADLARVLLWTVLVVGGVLVIFWLVREFPTQFRRRNEQVSVDHQAVADDGTRVTAATTLEEADRLAREGAYAEAMHMLLLHALEVMRRALKIDFRQSQTSREILARGEIGSDARTPLSMIVSAVELTYFGGRPADAADYRNCRLNFERFAAIGDIGA